MRKDQEKQKATTRKHRQYLLARAKSLWMSGVTASDISRELDINIQTVSTWANKYKWAEELDYIGSQAARAIVDNLRKRIDSNMARRLRMIEHIDEQIEENLKVGGVSPTNLEKLVNVMSGILKVEKQMVAQGYNEDIDGDEGSILEILRAENLENMTEEEADVV